MLFDAVFVSICLLSALVGILRGFTREFCGIMGWLGAVIVTLAAFSPVLHLAKQHLDQTWLAYTATTMVLFLPSYVLLRLSSSWLSRKIKGSFLSSLDRTLGALWGLIRGWFLCCIGFIMMGIFAPSTLTLYAGARTFSIVQSSSAWLISHLPSHLDGNSPLHPNLPPHENLSSSFSPSKTSGDLLAQRFSAMTVATSEPITKTEAPLSNDPLKAAPSLKIKPASESNAPLSEHPKNSVLPPVIKRRQH